MYLAETIFMKLSSEEAWDIFKPLQKENNELTKLKHEINAIKKSVRP